MSYLSRMLCILFIIANLPELNAADYSAGAQVGYDNGPGFRVSGAISDFAVDFPLEFQLGLGYFRMNPGDAADARRIFINDATNGIPEKRGWLWDIRFDFVYKTGLFSPVRSYFFGGPRYSLFTGNFKYVGGNEDFDVTSNQWGIGLGMKNLFKMTSWLNLVVTSGADYYLSSTLRGHDTAYNPDGDDQNARNDYEYDDADEAINQPKFKYHLLIGVSFSPGL